MRNVQNGALFAVLDDGDKHLLEVLARLDIRDLDDPLGALGGTEGIWSFATEGFAGAAPKAAQMFANLILSDAELADLEYLMVARHDRSDPDGAVVEWLGAHPDFADRLVRGTLG